VTRRRHPPPVADPDDYGFEIAGKGFRVTTAELLMLAGIDTVACALYMRCLKPFADRSGYVRNLSYYRCLHLLACAQSPRGGARLPEPTKKRVRRAFEYLAQHKLITVHFDDNRRDRALQVWINAAAGSKWASQRGRGSTNR
jgi:hypothetical protein